MIIQFIMHEVCKLIHVSSQWQRLPLFKMHLHNKNGLLQRAQSWHEEKKESLAKTQEVWQNHHYHRQITLILVTEVPTKKLQVKLHATQSQVYMAITLLESSLAALGVTGITLAHTSRCTFTAASRAARAAAWKRRSCEELESHGSIETHIVFDQMESQDCLFIMKYLGEFLTNKKLIWHYNEVPSH